MTESKKKGSGGKRSKKSRKKRIATLKIHLTIVKLALLMKIAFFQTMPISRKKLKLHFLFKLIKKKIFRKINFYPEITADPPLNIPNFKIKY